MIKKLSSVPEARCPTPDWGEYNRRKPDSRISLPVEYTVTGYIGHTIEPGQPLVIMRDTRNGIECGGIMTTSAVKSFSAHPNGLIIKTQNSVYELTWINEA